MKYQGNETDLQKTVARYLDQSNVLWTHVANERKTSVRQGRNGKYYSPEGSKLKQMGVKRGIPDVMIFESRGGYAGLAIELKVGSNKPSDDQLMWMTQLKKWGWLCMWSNDLDAIIETVDDYMNEPPTNVLKKLI